MKQELMAKRQTYKALITNIQRYSLNDGPGIRTTVFLKGCPLHCKWCHNVECINPWEEIYYFETKCQRCGLCNLSCPDGAIFPPSKDPKARKIDREKCSRCMKCVEVCPVGGLVSVGKMFSLEDILNEVKRDRLFYENSGGGVTVSGGEPLFQPDFTLEFLKRCKAEGFHTCLDSSLYVKWKVIEKVLPYVDLVLCDIKHMDTRRHFEGTGVFNELILENIRKVADNVPVRIRIPLIEGFNDSADNLEATAVFAKSLTKVDGVDILPFHSWASIKYNKLEMNYTYADKKDMTREEAQKAQELFKRYGFEATIGG